MQGTHSRQDIHLRRLSCIRAIDLTLFLLLALFFCAQRSIVASPLPELDDLRQQFRTPLREYTQVPFWFWNGEISEGGIHEQIASMEGKGVYGFVIHARMGLSKQVGYMTERWLALVRFAVEEAERRNMIVYLYDEGMYPSGSAHGRVVEGRADLASQGLTMQSVTITGPTEIALDDSIEAAVLLKPKGDRHLSQGRSFQAGDRVEVPEGDWKLFRFSRVPSGGVIRGIHFDEEDNLPGAPPSADLLNPEATQRFISETHDRYFQTLGRHFGHTIRGIFTDEPSILGRRARRGLRPWSTNLLAKISEKVGYEFAPFLPFLWVEAEDRLEEVVRADFDWAIASLLNESYYHPLSEWCDRHGIALTGHPAGGGDLDPQTYFQQPGQDVVWRWVLPGPTATEGEQSLTGKTASSMAVNLGRSTVINECFGAFGWRLTMQEMKWLSDWLFVRGANLLMPHAFYYSVEGERLFERPPDLAWNNLWWPQYSQFSQYTNRLSWLIRESTPVTGVAILAIDGKAEWRSAKALFESQIDFQYLPEDLVDTAEIKGGRLMIGQAKYHTVILDNVDFVRPRTRARLLRLLDGGLQLLALNSELQPHPLTTWGRSSTAQWGRSSTAHPVSWGRTSTGTSTQESPPGGRTSRAELPGLKQVSGEAELIRLLRGNEFDVRFEQNAPNIRFSHRTIGPHHFYFFTNEGLEPYSGILTLNQSRLPEEWDPESGEVRAIVDPQIVSGKLQMQLTLHPAGSTIIAFPDLDGPAAQASPASKVQPVKVLDLPSEGWKLTIREKTFHDVSLGSWTGLDGVESFSGTGWYERTIQLDGKPVRIDLGKVAESAEVVLNGQKLGTRLWQPFLFEAETEVLKGTNVLRIGITNTRSNELTDEKLPSGLFGPVRILVPKEPERTEATEQM
ncbi:MAG: hypothetical protein JSU96_00925 [Acidobacteriota bacterium]|nr:MAG: hypothetical protein JSU96_00925 [Acidobacteriota bacterium]